VEQSPIAVLTCRNDQRKACRPDGRRTETPSEGAARINVTQLNDGGDVKIDFDGGWTILTSIGDFATHNKNDLAGQNLVFEAVKKYADKNSDFLTPGHQEAFAEWERAIRDSLDFQKRKVIDLRPINYGELFAVRTVGEDGDEIHGYLIEDGIKFRLVRNDADGKPCLITEISLWENGEYSTREPATNEEYAFLVPNDFIQIAECFIRPILEEHKFNQVDQGLNKWTKHLSA